MANPVKREEITRTLTRQKWQAKIRAGIDPSQVLGLTPDVIDGATAFSQVVTNNLKDIGAIETLDIVQTRTMVERLGFGPNPTQPFEVVPTSLTVALKATKAVLFNLSEAEAVFNFFPNNLLHQQLPFIIQVDLPGLPAEGSTPASPPVTHFFLGCWFINSNLRFSVTERDDQKLIQTCDIKCARMVTQDSSNASSTAAGVAKTTIGGVLAYGNNQALLDDFGLT